MTITITADEARELLTRAVEEKGADYIYPRVNNPDGCLYFEGNAPSCIVGHVLAYKGMEPFEDEGELNASTVHSLRHHMLFEVDNDRTFEALRAAQTWQDSGETWGDTLRVALDVLDTEVK